LPTETESRPCLKHACSTSPSSLALQVWPKCCQSSSQHRNDDECSKRRKPITPPPPGAKRPSQRNVGRGWPSGCPPAKSKDKCRSDETCHQPNNESFLGVGIHNEAQYVEQYKWDKVIG
jgi:hypothetical protein